MDSGTKRESQPHILNAASNLLGICFVLVAGLKVTGAGKETILDEIAIGTSMLFVVSCLLSYVSIRTTRKTLWFEHWADIFFLLGLVCLTGAIGAYGLDILASH